MDISDYIKLVMGLAAVAYGVRSPCNVSNGLIRINISRQIQRKCLAGDPLPLIE
jgi:hypothetical protein